MKTKSRKERKEFIAFCVSEEEKEFIVNQAAIRDMSISDYCRKALMRSDSLFADFGEKPLVNKDELR